jgi:U3 small nucleolar RNA-associated protein MPP10
MAPGIFAPQSGSSIPIQLWPQSHPPPADPDPSSHQILLSALSSTADTFLQPSSSLHAACLVVAKRYLDPLAEATSAATERRLQQARRKRKRGEVGDYTPADVLRLTKVYGEGFDVAQVWEQARRIVNASTEEVQRALADSAHPVIDNDRHTIPPDEIANDKPGKSRLKHGQDSSEDDAWELDSGSDGRSFRGDGEVADTNIIDDGQSGGSVDLNHEGSREPEANSRENPDEDPETDSEEDSGDVFVRDKNGLNDGFFSIDDFNKQSQLLEQQDARGDLGNEDASEDEDIDWAADPLKLHPSRNGRPSIGDEDGEQDSTDDDDGPTFGNADLDGSDSDEDMEADIDSMQNTNDIRYADFFAPPARQGTKRTRRRPLPKTQPPAKTMPETELDIQRTISEVRRDIFEDDVSEAEYASDVAPDAPSGGEPSGRSNHQRRQAALAAEIRKLEAANVAKRDWTLSGEARAADRPLNSLLEEDLEFERAGKPIPVITNEVSEDIEALIKRRIIAREFDEVIRRRPDNLATGDRARRGRFELDDTKPQQSLAEIYEAEHMKTADPEGYVDPGNAKLKEQHAAIEALWKEVSAKLDGLSSLHFKPKPPTATITVVADVPAITMEDARPSAGGEVDGTSMLAPQEVYKVGQGRTHEDRVREVVRKGGAVVGREEMGREERRRARRREKERARKRGGVGERKSGAADSKDANARGGKAQRKRDEAKQVEATLKMGGVRVIDRKGEIRDVRGKPVKDGAGIRGGGATFRL